MNRKSSLRALSAVLSLTLLLSATSAQAATSPSLGLADSFGILSNTFTNTTSGTTINGDLGYTTGPAEAPTVNGTTYIADATYSQAGIDQGTALADLNGQPCTFTFPMGAVDLASNVQFASRIYGPGVYCIDGAASIGTAGITLSGAGTYIFRMTGALTTVASSEVTLADGATDCDVWWTPGAATTLGANSIFKGTVIDAAGITVESMVRWVGRALAFGGTVTTDTDTITASTCTVPSATLTVTKTVINDDNGTLAVSDFPLFVGGVSVTSGVATTTLAPGSYLVSETSNGDYDAGDWGGDCAADGSITLVDGDVKTCTITNDDEEVSGGGGSRRSRPEPVASTTDTVASTTTTVVANNVPRLPNAGLGPSHSGTYLLMFVIAGLVLAIRRKDEVVSVDAV